MLMWKEVKKLLKISIFAPNYMQIWLKLRLVVPSLTENLISNIIRLMKKSLAHFDILGDLAADYCPELAGLIPRESESQKKLFALLDYAYIGARYDRSYKITKEQLEQLSPCVKKLHEVTERVCKEKIESFV